MEHVLERGLPEASQNFGSRLTRIYVVALSLIVSSILMGGYFLHTSLMDQEQEARTLNVAGAQRMLSQRIVALTMAAQSSNEAGSKAIRKAELMRTYERMRAGHHYLTRPKGGAPAPAQSTPELAKYYGPEGQNLDARVDTFLGKIDVFIKQVGSGKIDVATQSELYDEALGELLVDLDGAVSLYETAAQRKLDDATRMHKQSLVLALFVLGLEVVFVFRPLARQAAGRVEAAESASASRSRLLSSAMQAARMGYWHHEVSRPAEIWLSEELARIYEIADGQLWVPIDTLGRYTDPKDKVRVSAKIQECRDAGIPQKLETRICKPCGKVIDIDMDLFASRDSSGEITSITGVVRDITEEVAARARVVETMDLLQHQANDLAEAQQLGKTAMWRIQLGSKKLDLSEEAYTLLGYERNAIADARTQDDYTAQNGMHLRALCIGDSFDRLMGAQREAIISGESQTVDITMRRGDSSLADVSVRIKVQRDENGRGVALFGTIQDISDRREAERQLEQLAYYDHLTGLANRALCTRKLKALCKAAPKRETSAALVLIDLDDFKEVNDGLGHQAGDEFLQEVARRLSQIAGTANFTARLGGDEFAVIIETAANRQDVETLVGQMLHAITLPVTLGAAAARGAASAGICMIPDDTNVSEEALRYADLALYEAKESGRNRLVSFDPSMSSRLQSRLGMSKDLRAALGTPALQTHFQPIVSGVTGHVVGYETLMRWNHPDKGWISPAAFIPVAESSHLIGDLGEFAMVDACVQASKWAKQGHDFEVAVNVSAAQLWQGDLEKIVEKALQHSRLQPERLCIELTESVFVGESVDRIEAILRRLKARGIKLALDDFGTGYSSLGYLNNLPFDKLKVDRCFVSGADVFKERFQLLEGIVGLARGLKMEVVAEGVETRDELRVVQSLGVDGIQGFYFGKAEPANVAIATAQRLAEENATMPDENKLREEMGELNIMDAMNADKTATG